MAFRRLQNAQTRINTVYFSLQNKTTPHWLMVNRRLQNAQTRINTVYFSLQNKTTPHWLMVK